MLSFHLIDNTMPQKRKSSLGRRPKRSNVRELQPTPEAPQLTFQQHYEVAANSSSVIEDVQQMPSTSNVHYISGPDMDTAQNQVQQGETEDIGDFNERIMSLNGNERRTAFAFASIGIENDFLWPTANETKSDAWFRQHQNAAALHAARMHKFRKKLLSKALFGGFVS